MMKRYLVCGAFTSVFLFVATWAFAARAQKPESYAPGQIIIKFNPPALPTDALLMQSALHATVKRRFDHIGAELWEIDGMSVPDAVALYQSDPRVAYVEPNYIVRANDLFPNDPRFSELWGLHNTGQTGGTADADIDAPEAWSLGTGGTVLVGVIDTGVDWQHVDLAANIYTNPGEIPGNGIDDDANDYVDDVHGWDFVNHDNDPYDDHGHGTHVSGTIAAVGNNGIGVVGVSWSARILPLKFLDADGYGSTSDAVLAVQYATRMGVKLTSNSWGGGGYSQALSDAIREAGDHGILFVAAAGNDGMDNDDSPHYPSNYALDNVISVASTDPNDARSWFSNYGLISVDLGAPGSNILSTFPNNRYGSISGTSMATPHVSGAVSLVWAAAPEMTHLEVKDAILSTVHPLPALAGKVVSGGRLNVHALLASLDDVAPAPVNTLAVESTGSSSSRLAWTATGDDSTLGTASIYDLRYSTAVIDASSFDAATTVAGMPHPAPAGSSESFEVTGLDFNTTYHFALVVEDEQGNRSALSNVADGTTLGVPHLSYSPGSFAADLLTGGTAIRLLTVSNTAEGTLDFATLPPSWARLNPPSGRVNAGQSLQVEVIFDATGLSGGAHESTFTLATNDPAQRAVPIPLSLQVTDAADISVSRTALDFGALYTSLCLTDSVIVTNIGTVALDVSRIEMSNPEFSADSTLFSLAPGESRTLPILYCPVSVGTIEATLSMQSNDPDHPTCTVSLRGEGIDPPIIVVSPAHVAANLFTGGTWEQTLSITNDGGSDLSFALAIENLGGPTPPTGIYVDGKGTRDRQGASTNITPATPGDTRAPATRSYAGKRAGSRTGAAETPRPVDNLSVSHLRVLLLHAGEVSEIRDLLLVFPDISVVDEFDGGAATPTLAALKAYDAVILINNSSFMDPTAVGDVLADYVDGGGGVIMTLASFIAGWDVQGRFASGGYYPFTRGSGPGGYASMSNYDQAHRIMKGVTSAWGDLLGEMSVAPGAKWVADWDNGYPFVATQGDHVVGVNAFLADGGYWGGDLPLILHNALGWAAGAGWLKIEPTQGVVAAHTRVDLSVKFDAAALLGGDYAAMLHIANNGLVSPDMWVPAGVRVMGAADVVVSQTLLDYGPQFIGAAIQDTLVVTNEGTDLLTVKSISSSHANYTVDVSDFTLAPFQRQDVVVTFAPTATGPIPAMLTVTSSDIDEGVVTVELRGVGVEPPIISVTPEFLSEDLLTGGTATHTMTITNSGESALAFNIAMEDRGGPTPAGADPQSGSRLGAIGASVLFDVSVSSPKAPAPRDATRVVPPATIRKGQRESRSYPPMTHASGGPDPFGYRWRDSNEAGGPTFNWIDTSAGTNIWLSDDDFESDIPLGFTFSYYGEEFTTIGVGSNGWLSFNGIDGWFPEGVPLEDDWPGAIAPFAGDLYPPEANYVRYRTFGTAPRRQFVIEYNHIPDYEGGSYKTFEVILTERTNSIRFQYLVAPNLPIGFGIESPDQSMGMGNAGTDDLFISPTLVRNNYAIEFTATPVWLEADPLDAVVPPHSSVDVTVTFDAAGLNGGDYAANLLVDNNDPLSAEVVVPVDMHVTGAPDISVTPISLTFDPLFIGKTVNKTLVVSNTGTDLLAVSSISSSYLDYTVDVATFSLAPKTSRNVVVTFAPTSAGSLPATLSFASNDVDEGVVEVTLQGTGVEPPVISVTPMALSEDLFTGGTATHVLTIDNSAGGSDLIWTASVKPVQGSGAIAWVHVVPASGTVPAHGSAVLNANFDAASLYGGDYDASLVIASNDPLTPEVVVSAHMHVTGVTDISVTPLSLNYGSLYIGQTVNKTVTVLNAGTDSLIVSSVSSNHADYAADVTNFSLQPRASRDIMVSFAPTTPGVLAGQISFTSNDPDEGTVSVQVTGTGVEPPVISVTPLVLADTLSVAEIATHALTVSNTGASDLDITITLIDVPRPNAVAFVSGNANDAVRAVPLADIGKGENDTRTYPPMARGSGGPDPFGYQWRDSNEPGGPSFHWIDVSGGTSIPLADDDFVAGIPLGFTFRYYGDQFTTIGVGSNGWLSFNGSNMWFPGNVPLGDNCAGAIAPYARDLLAPSAAYIRYQTFGSAPHRQFVIEYNRIPEYGNLLQKTFEVILTEGANSIRFQYLVAPNPPSGFGIESPDQTMGMGNTGVGDLFINPGLVSDHYAIEFAGIPEWLTVVPSPATIPPGESLDLVATMDATNLQAGEYAAIISIASNDPVHPTVSVNVLLRLDAALLTGAVQTIAMPTRYELHANRPNPFNPTTRIAYDLPRAVEVRLVIYDVQGREVMRLASGVQPAGRHEIVWDGHNSSHEPVASGVYFYRLLAGDFVQTKKMVLLK